MNLTLCKFVSSIAIAIMKPPSSSMFVFDMYFAATTLESSRSKHGNKIQGNNAVTEIGRTSKIQNDAKMIRTYLYKNFYIPKKFVGKICKKIYF